MLHTQIILSRVSPSPSCRMLIILLHAHNRQSVHIRADIAGANAAGWPSVLVKTGVYDPARGPPTHTPTYIAEDVEEAVRWAIEREMGRK